MKWVTTENEWRNTSASNEVRTEMPYQSRALVDASSLVAVSNTACTNDASFKNRTETFPFLKRRQKRRKMRASLLEYVDTRCDACRPYCTFFVPIFHSTLSVFIKILVMSCSEVLSRLFYVSMATIALVGVTVPS